jgi:hypothetical protein
MRINRVTKVSCKYATKGLIDQVSSGIQNLADFCAESLQTAL